MRKKYHHPRATWQLKLLAWFMSSLACHSSFSQERLIYHNIVTDPSGKIVPWYNPNPGISFDHVVGLAWKFWDGMRRDVNGLPYYMNHQVWRGDFNDPRGIGGDQFSMALSSWRSLYAYTGDEKVKDNMRFIADYYLSHSLSSPDAKWPNIPYPYNCLVYSGQYDGDMILGKDYTQPDKAGSFGFELLNLYKLFSGEVYPNVTPGLYLAAAIKIANTLASHMSKGDSLHSPMPFKVNAITGETGMLKSNRGTGEFVDSSSYTTNWSGTMGLFLGLEKLHAGDTMLYQEAFSRLLDWMKKYPLRTNRWGPFFEDVPGWSDTQINAISFASFIMEHPAFFPDWRKQVKAVFAWVYGRLSNKSWNRYGVTVINEQTAYLQPGNSHTSRQAAAELEYTSLTHDSSYYVNAVRQLSWATYMVDEQGRNLYPNDANWLTDGYGDYVRHFIKAMGYSPDLAPDSIRLLSSTSVVQQVFYKGQFEKIWFPPFSDTAGALLFYKTFDQAGEERIRFPQKPGVVLFDGHPGDNTVNGNAEWMTLPKGGWLVIRRKHASAITIKQ